MKDVCEISQKKLVIKMSLVPFAENLASELKTDLSGLIRDYIVILANESFIFRTEGSEETEVEINIIGKGDGEKFLEISYGRKDPTVKYGWARTAVSFPIFEGSSDIEDVTYDIIPQICMIFFNRSKYPIVSANDFKMLFKYLKSFIPVLKAIDLNPGGELVEQVFKIVANQLGLQIERFDHHGK